MVDTPGYRIYVVTDYAGSPHGDEAADVAEGDVVATIDDVLVIAGAGELRDDARSVGLVYSGGADTEDVPAASPAAPGKDATDGGAGGAVAGPERSSSYSDVVAGYEGVPEGPAGSEVDDSPQASTKAIGSA